MSGLTDNPGLADAGSQVSGMLSSGLAALGQYKIFFIIILALVVIGVIFYVLSIFRKKKTQWTHVIEFQRILPNGQLSKKVLHKARRFQLDTGTENFELEKPILGNYIIPRVGDYVDMNKLSVVADKDNRIYKKGELKVDKEGNESISLVHAGVDVAWSDLKAKYQHAHKNAKKITTRELIKAGITALIIIGIVIVGVVALGKWAEVSEFKSKQAEQNAIAMENLGEAVEMMQAVVNTQQLQITPMLKALYQKENIVEEIDRYRKEIEEQR